MRPTGNSMHAFINNYFYNILLLTCSSATIDILRSNPRCWSITVSRAHLSRFKHTRISPCESALGTGTTLSLREGHLTSISSDNLHVTHFRVVSGCAFKGLIEFIFHLQAGLPTLSWGKASPRNRIFSWSGLTATATATATVTATTTATATATCICDRIWENPPYRILSVGW